MEYIIRFQYKAPNNKRPTGGALNEDEILEKDGKNIPIPNVGDSISLERSEDVPGYYKVLTRHFHYHPQFCYVTIVVSDIADEEMATRLKD
jgi:hypothetical protein